MLMSELSLNFLWLKVNLVAELRDISCTKDNATCSGSKMTIGRVGLLCSELFIVITLSDTFS